MDESQICLLPATTMAAMIASREISASELLEAHLHEIERCNPAVNAIVTLTKERARDLAAAADRRTMSGEPLGCLHGLPVAHKDTIQTKGIRTTFGSPLFVDNVPDEDDLIVERLELAGAITIGKTNTPEFAAGSHTVNRVFGATRNPYDPRLSAGGSSGGAAVALALGMHPIADGSDMGGSLRNPASFCGVVGLRPSFGRVPNVPMGVPGERLSVPGAMARNVGDVALMMRAIAGPDSRAPQSLRDSGEIFAAFGSARKRRRRVGFSVDLGGMFPVERPVRDVLERCPEIFASLGWEVVDELPDLRGADEIFRVLRAAQFAEAFGALVDRHPDQIKETIKWNVAVGRALGGKEIERARDARNRIIVEMTDYFSRVDLIGLTVSQVAPFPIEWEYPKTVDGEAMGDYLEWMASCYLVSVTGLPAISIPFGFTGDGLPVGVQLVGPPQGDLDLLEAANEFEAATMSLRRIPPMLRTPSEPE